VSQALWKNDAMKAYRAQAHLDASLDEVWALVGNPATYPEWWPVAVEIRGESFEVGDAFTQVLEIAGRRLEYSRVIDRRDELKELRWHCPTTGGFQHWLLTDAQGGTFVDMEMGIDPPALRYRLVGCGFIKRWAEDAIDGLRQALTTTPNA
jgi:Polyketide cyclase / dehydrase and lipid transport